MHGTLCVLATQIAKCAAEAECSLMRGQQLGGGVMWDREVSWWVAGCKTNGCVSGAVGRVQVTFLQTSRRHWTSAPSDTTCAPTAASTVAPTRGHSASVLQLVFRMHLAPGAARTSAAVLTSQKYVGVPHTRACHPRVPRRAPAAPQR